MIFSKEIQVLYKLISVYLTCKCEFGLMNCVSRRTIGEMILNFSRIRYIQLHRNVSSPSTYGLNNKTDNSSIELTGNPSKDDSSIISSSF